MKDIAAAFANPDGSFVFVEASGQVESEIANAIKSGFEPVCIFGWETDGKLRCRAVPEYRNSEKQVTVLFEHKRRLVDGTNPV